MHNEDVREGSSAIPVSVAVECCSKNAQISGIIAAT